MKNFERPRAHDPNEDTLEIVSIEGRRYAKVPTGYSIRQWFSHNTLEKGPGPGWDQHLYALEEYGVKRVEDLPDEAYYRLDALDDAE